MGKAIFYTTCITAQLLLGFPVVASDLDQAPLQADPVMHTSPFRLNHEPGMKALHPLASRGPTLMAIALNKPSQKITLEELRSHLTQWNQQGIQDYRFTIDVFCFCPALAEPIVIEVQNGVMTSQTYAASGQPVNPHFLREYNTIPKLFRMLRVAVRRRASYLSATFDPTAGYPTTIDINYDEGVADDEISIRISDLQTLQVP